MNEWMDTKSPERGTSERNNQKQNTVAFPRSSGGELKSRSRGRINGAAPRGNVYPGFELELAGAECP